jgi:hypothetical protein
VFLSYLNQVIKDVVCSIWATQIFIILVPSCQCLCLYIGKTSSIANFMITGPVKWFIMVKIGVRKVRKRTSSAVPGFIWVRYIIVFEYWHIRFWVLITGFK